MNNIRVERIRIRNFRSILSEDIAVPQTDGLKLLSGENLIEPGLGANGCGKSSLFDALCWCFYGSSVRGAKTSQILSWGQEQVEVTVDVVVEGTTYSVKRTGPPSKAFINEQPVEQPDVDFLVGLTKKRFLHSVIFGQGVPLLPDLPLTERGELFDEVLSLETWSKCSERAGEKYRELDNQLAVAKSDLRFVEGKLAALPEESAFNRKINEWEAEHRGTIAVLKEEVESWEQQRKEKLHILNGKAIEWINRRECDLLDLQIKQKAWQDSIDERCSQKAVDLEEAETSLQRLRSELEAIPKSLPSSEDKLVLTVEQLKAVLQSIASVETEKHLLSERMEKFASMEVCPECEQPITSKKKKEKATHFHSQLLSLGSLLDSHNSSKDVLEQEKEALSAECQKQKEMATEAAHKAGDIKAQIRFAEKKVKDLEKEARELVQEHDAGNPFDALLSSHLSESNPYLPQIEELQQETNPYAEAVREEEVRENPYIAELADMLAMRRALDEDKLIYEAAITSLSKQLLAAEYWKHGFKKIRLYFVQQVLTALEVEIQSAVNALGLNGWHVKLATETENKSGGLKLGIQIHIVSPSAEGSWECWSGGEAQRLRLAIGLGLSSLIQRAAGVWFDMLILDEPTSWLSSEGIEDLLACLQHYSEVDSKAIWVVDHRALQHSGFKEIWLMVKSEQGSKLELVSTSA